MSGPDEDDSGVNKLDDSGLDEGGSFFEDDELGFDDDESGFDDEELGFDDEELGFDDEELGFDDEDSGFEDEGSGFEDGDSSGSPVFVIVKSSFSWDIETLYPLGTCASVICQLASASRLSHV